jgi:hypothetical protein
MATKTLSGFFGDTFHHQPQARPIHPVVHRRRASALVLTALTFALGVILFAVYGSEVLAVYLPALPMAFILLWGSTGALRFDERRMTGAHAA